MRISRHIASMLVAACAVSAAPALAFEGTAPGPVRPATALTTPSAGLATPAGVPVPPMPVPTAAPANAVVGKGAPLQQDSLTALQYQAEGGHSIAQWRLGRMYADGNGVDR